jgi:NADH:ubiquinone oxidoreductase subunit 4 (subunit M)
VSGPVAKALAGTGAKLVDLRWQEWLALIPLIALIFYLGIFPATLTGRTEAATQQILTATQQVAPPSLDAPRGA